MQTKNLIQTQANVIKITSLTKGNIVKLIDTNYSSKEVKYGIVTDLLNDGEKTFIELLEYKKNYDSVSSDIKIYEGTDELALFPAKIDEVQEYFNSAIEGLERTIKEKKEELLKLENGHKKAIEFSSGELEKKLSEASFEEVSQEDYNHKKELKEQQLKELQD